MKNMKKFFAAVLVAAVFSSVLAVSAFADNYNLSGMTEGTMVYVNGSSYATYPTTYSENEARQLVTEWLASASIPDNTEIYNTSPAALTQQELVAQAFLNYYVENVLPYQIASVNSNYQSNAASQSYVNNEGYTVLTNVDFSGFSGLSEKETQQLISEWLTSVY